MQKKYTINVTLILLILFVFSSVIIFSQEKNVLRWAADTESGAPYAYQDPKDPSKIIGFEVDLVNEICKELGMTSKFVQNQWDGLIPGLKRNEYDIAINGIEITDDRKEEINFSIPYYLTFEQLVVRKDQNDITSLSNLISRKVGTLQNSLAERILRSAQGVEVKSYESEKNAYTDLENGRLSAVLIDSPVVTYYAGWNPQLKLVGQPIGEISYGIAIRKNDTILLEKINNVIIKLKSSGQLREILESWNLWNVMMAKYLNDDNPSNMPKSNFLRYIESKNKPVTFNVLYDRYMSYLPQIGIAAITTLEISILSMILAIFLGLFISLVRVYSPKPFSNLAVLYIETIRGTPLLIQLFFIFYALPSLGIMFSPFVAAILGLGLNYAAYEAENYRAGLSAVPRGQLEAAISLGMNRIQAIRFIIIPQAVRIVIPPITNDFISLLKDSSLVSVITLTELTKLYGQLSATYFDYVGTGILIALTYLLLGLPFVKLSKYVEKKYAIDKRKMAR